MSQPVYRRPRSHAYSCRCERCDRPGSGAAKFFWGSLAVLVLLAGVCALLGTVARAFTVSAWHTLGITVPLLVLVAVIIAVRVANGRDSRNRRRRIRAADREPPGRLRGQAAGLPDGFSVEEELARLRAELRLQGRGR